MSVLLANNIYSDVTLDSTVTEVNAADLFATEIHVTGGAAVRTIEFRNAADTTTYFTLVLEANQVLKLGPFNFNSTGLEIITNSATPDCSVHIMYYQ